MIVEELYGDGVKSINTNQKQPPERRMPKAGSSVGTTPVCAFIYHLLCTN